ncbi:hypothetical protein PPSIR1_25771 [Plesiocystis pacifica SIR-1]|uniref:ATP-grasp domain-containing protein n=1 Tax=Plesiocystis pacifica SIR-1 TaxID=391625 RepID=A6FZG8_9BACT|nr:hypothetical protein [Plesiocystis pacifica]EDM81052.1 hypothetical protein PPSIR1_25771 [Plesiocystis pacifica SIR-1]
MTHLSMAAPRLALVTCATVPEWEVDDEPLRVALGERGVVFEQPTWDDSGVDWGRFDAALIRTTWDYQRRPEAFLAWTRRVEARTRLFNPAPVIAWNLHKGYLRELEAAGVPIAPSVWLRAGEDVDLAALLAREVMAGGRAFLKPLVAANSDGTLRFDTGDAGELEAAQRHLDVLLAQGRDMVLQPYLGSVETEGEYSVLEFDGRVSHAVRKIPVAGDYRVQDDHGASDEAWTPDAEALELVRRCREAVRARFPGLDAPLLYARVDLLRDAGGGLVVNELELIEPSLFFRHDAGAGPRLAEALLARV